MFDRPWSWLVPLIGALGVITGVLLTTPPGFGAIPLVAFGSPRGPVGDAAAYTLGSAASLGLLTLLVLALICAGVEYARRRTR